MPRARLQQPAQPDLEHMVDLIVSQWARPSDDPSAPVIIVDDPAESILPVRLHVIWDRWDNLDFDQRWEIVARAAESILTADQSQRMSRAAGLTSDEARNKQLEYEIESPTAGGS